MLQTVFTTKGSEQSFTHSAAWQKVIVFIEKPSLHYVLIKCKITNPFVTLRSVKRSQEMSCILRTMWVSTSRPRHSPFRQKVTGDVLHIAYHVGLHFQAPSLSVPSKSHRRCLAYCVPCGSPLPGPTLSVDISPCLASGNVSGAAHQQSQPPYPPRKFGIAFVSIP